MLRPLSVSAASICGLSGPRVLPGDRRSRVLSGVADDFAAAAARYSGGHCFRLWARGDWRSDDSCWNARCSVNSAGIVGSAGRDSELACLAGWNCSG